MAIADDIDYDLTNKIVKRKTGAGATVYTVNALYSWLMDEFDELTQMDDLVPMSAQTPTAYTVINGWYLQEELTKYLETGAISTSGYIDDIRTLHCQAGGWTTFDSGDIGSTVTGSITGDTGELLDYDNAAFKLWVRMDAAGDLFDDDGENYACNGENGTANAISTTGEHLFANLYTLGTIEGTPQLYIFQDGERITGWWGTGHIDVLIKVTESGADIDTKHVSVFARNLSDYYDIYYLEMSSSGKDAVPLGTADDPDNQTAEATIAGWQSGGTPVGISFDFAAPVYSYDIGDGNGAQDYECQIDCNGRTLAQVYEVCKWWTRESSTFTLNENGTNVDGEEYRYAKDSYTEVKLCPFGTYVGGKFYGARSIYFINLNGADVKAFQLIDAAGVTRNPPNKQAFTVSGLVVGDRIGVYESTGAGLGVVDKSQHTMTIQAGGLGTVTVSSAIPNSTPEAGTLVLVESTTGAEEVCAYTSYTGAVFTLAGVTGNAYDGADHCYVPFLYVEAASAEESEGNCVYTADLHIVCRVRKKGILPFETTGTYSSTGYSTTAVRTADGVVT